MRLWEGFDNTKDISTTELEILHTTRQRREKCKVISACAIHKATFIKRPVTYLPDRTKPQMHVQMNQYFLSSKPHIHS
jgi:hypothetical protein